MTAKVIEGGRLVLPAAVRRALSLSKGDTVVLEVEGDEVRIRSAQAAIRRIQERLKPYRNDCLASEELIAERRAEAAREECDR